MTDILPRFVGKNFVVMPEEIYVIAPRYGYIQWVRNGTGYMEPIEGFRKDRQTGRTDANGKAIFERDRVWFDAGRKVSE